MYKKTNFIIFTILLIGFVYRLLLTSDGSFLFNMDNARDLVDVREMVELKKLRLTGPTSAIEGFFNGPAWYYLLAVPYVLSNGNPYSAILLQIFLWAVGGYFLLKLVSRLGTWLVFPIGIIWIASNYMVLATSYSFNPNPVTLLSPLFIYLLVKYLETEKLLYAISVFLLGGLFFNFEMNFGIFTPLIIFTSLIIYKRKKLFQMKSFWLGSVVYALCLLPQVLFDLKHDFLMSNSILNYLRNTPSSGFNPLKRFEIISNTFFGVFIPTLMNHQNLAKILVILSVPVIYKYFQNKQFKNEPLVLVSLLYIFIPFLGYVLLPVTVNTWHIGGPMAVSLILIAYVLKKIKDVKLIGFLTSAILTLMILYFGFLNIADYFKDKEPNNDPSLFANEIKAIDYVYKYADGKNFKVYTYLPSVIDYPYQYLIWWHGKNTYGYLPADYAYHPGKPEYISNKPYFSAKEEDLKKREDSKLVFLIKEPDRIKMRRAWEDDFDPLQFISKETFGSIEIEIRKEN